MSSGQSAPPYTGFNGCAWLQFFFTVMVRVSAEDSPSSLVNEYVTLMKWRKLKFKAKFISGLPHFSLKC